MIDDFNSTVTRLDTCTETIASTESALATKHQALRDLERAYAEHRSFLEYEVMSDPAYKNAEARKAALAVVLARNDEAKQLTQQLNAAQTEIAMLQVERDDASRIRQNILAMLAFLTADKYHTAPVAVGGIR